MWKLKEEEGWISVFGEVTYVHPPMCAFVFPCQGRYVVLALDSTCCSWTHWAQLAPWSIWLCGGVCVRAKKTEKKNERHCGPLCCCHYEEPLYLHFFVCFLYYIMWKCVLLLTIINCSNCALLLQAWTHTETEAIRKSQRPPSPLQRGPGTPLPSHHR